MRTLVLLRGLPGCGKSTFIKERNWEEYTLSMDKIRLMLGGPILNIDSSYEISQDNDKKVVKLLVEMLESRMKEGAFTIIDATNVHPKSFNNYLNLAIKYKYRMYCIDFTDIPLEEVKRRNAGREPFKRVPEEVIEKFNSRLEKSNIPRSVTVLKPEEWEQILIKPIDLSSYERIHHIGDIHGCYTVLKEYIQNNGNLNSNEYYIFTGDFVDRGIENVEVLEFICSIMDEPNVQLLEGNHEKWIFMFANNEPSHSKVFEQETKIQLEKAQFSKKKLRSLVRRLGQCAYYTYNEKTVLVTHGGLSTIPENLLYVSTNQMIKGVGRYEDYTEVVKSFHNSTNENIYQINGHRNVEEYGIRVQLPDGTLTNCFNLEGQVEFGGCLRAVQLTKDGFTEVAIQNNVFDGKKTEIELIKSNEFINEKKFGDISSLNFSLAAFKKGIWDKQTVKARGLYINNKTNKVVARGYEKFFNVEEMEETSLKSLKANFKFPIDIYLKYNGFLGLASSVDDTLFPTTKSNPESDHAKWFKDMLDKVNPEKMEALEKYARDNNSTFLFEVIDPIHDPHIISYNKSKFILLDIIKNDIKTFKKLPYKELEEVSKELGLKLKEHVYTLNTWEEFETWYNTVIADNYKYNNKYVEGFVIEDAAGFQVKIKTEYYKKWKRIRGGLTTILENPERVNDVENLEAKEFFEWILKKNNLKDIKVDRIAELRDSFLSENLILKTKSK